MPANDSDIVSEFLAESYENLDRLDRELVSLEKDPQNRDSLAGVFRTIHTIMPPLFTKMLADRLASRSRIPVDEGAADVPLAPGHAWIAPGNFHMTVKRAGLSARLSLNQDPPENSCRPAVDVLFRSVASMYGASALAIVMTGMGADGVIGSRKIREAGGHVIIQDEASSVVWGMPGLVYAAGQADGVFPLNQLAAEITRRVTESRASGSARRAADHVTL